VPPNFPTKSELEDGDFAQRVVRLLLRIRTTLNQLGKRLEDEELERSIINRLRNLSKTTANLSRRLILPINQDELNSRQVLRLSRLLDSMEKSSEKFQGFCFIQFHLPHSFFKDAFCEWVRVFFLSHLLLVRLFQEKRDLWCSLSSRISRHCGLLKQPYKQESP
jgi:hypothetical protein